MSEYKWCEKFNRADVPYPITGKELFALLDKLGLDYELREIFEGLRVVSFEVIEAERDYEDV